MSRPDDRPMLVLQIGFPTGRCCAAHHANPREPEWPPHPSRVYSALVAAACMAGRSPSDTERRLLNWLADAEPPALAFPDADLAPAPDCYVPVNDTKSRLSAGNSPGLLEPNRQVRQFPSAFLLGRPELSLGWALDPDDEDLAVLDSLASRMTHIGTSHSLVVARFMRQQAPIAWRWLPDEAGPEHLRVAARGRLEELDLLVAARAEPASSPRWRRPVPACERWVGYRPLDRSTIPLTPARHEWLGFRLDQAHWRVDQADTLARAARRAVMALIGTDLPAALHGHASQGAPAEHVAWLPLPDVGHGQASGRILGLAVGLPPSLAPAVRQRLLRALQQLQWLHLPDRQTARLTPVIESEDTPLALRQASWCRASAVWTSVTPVVLDRPPKRAEPERLLAALVDSIVNAGLPVPVEARIGHHSEIDGAPAARDIQTRLPRWHATVRFAGPVEGPVIAGRWRHFGIGLFRPAT